MGIGRQARIDLVRQYQHEGTIATMICPNCSQLATPDRGAIADETVYQCKSCDLYTVQGGFKWIEGGPYLIGELRIIAELRDRDVKAGH
jgi:hypothetical protein